MDDTHTLQLGAPSLVNHLEHAQPFQCDGAAVMFSKIDVRKAARTMTFSPVVFYTAQEERCREDVVFHREFYEQPTYPSPMWFEVR